MSARFLQLNIEKEKDHEGDWLALRYPQAFILLYFIARRARRYNGCPDGLIIGDALIGSTDFEPKMTRQNFRSSIKKLVELGYIKIVSNGKSFFDREKSTINVTINVMLVNLCDTRIWDLNSEDGNQQINQRPTNDQPTTNHKQRKKKIEKIDKKDHPSIPSNENESEHRDESLMTDDFSFSEIEKKEIVSGVFLTCDELKACLKIKGSMDKVKEAIAFIQESKARKYSIASWPNALATWKIPTRAKVNMQDHIAYAEELCKEFQEYTRGWRCYMYHDRKKDQRGVLFESQSAYQEAFFVALVDPLFQKKCKEFIKNKNMSKKGEIL